MAKQKYRLANWSEYNRALVNRGSLLLWIDGSVAKTWFAIQDPGRQGRRRVYSNHAIMAMMYLKALFHLPYRGLQGMVISLMTLANLALPVPCYQQMQKRAAKLTLDKKISKARPSDIVIDASGVKVYGAGEWQQERKNQKGRKKWKKIHIAMDPKSGEIIVEDVTDSACHDSTMLPKLVNQCSRCVKTVYADGAYDTLRCYDALYAREMTGKIPPRQGAVIHSDGPPAFTHRNEAVRIIVALGQDAAATKLWKKLIGYGRRSLVETAFSRFKRAFGERLWSVKDEMQAFEVGLKWRILNRFTKLGRPLSYAV